MCIIKTLFGLTVGTVITCIVAIAIKIDNSDMNTKRMLSGESINEEPKVVKVSNVKVAKVAKDVDDVHEIKYVNGIVINNDNFDKVVNNDNVINNETVVNSIKQKENVDNNYSFYCDIETIDDDYFFCNIENCDTTPQQVLVREKSLNLETLWLSDTELSSAIKNEFGSIIKEPKRKYRRSFI
jgi:hypothetical protein